MLLLKLFFAFIQVGMFSVGGGYAAIPLIQEQIVNIYGLMTLEEFSDLITVAEMTPGPISINSATFVGMRIAGIPGVLLCSIGCIIPSFFICLTLAHFYYKYRTVGGVQVDLAIVEGAIKNENVMITPICEDELVIVCGKTHPLAAEPIVTLEMLEGQDYVSRESGSVERNQFEKLFEEQGLHLNRTFRSTNTEAIKNAVICGRGIAIFSKRMVSQEVLEGEMVILHLKDIKMTRTFDFVIHKNKYRSNEIKVIQEMLCSGGISFAEEES